MKYEGYEAAGIADDLSTFEFLSDGRRGKFLKLIVFRRTEYENLFNLVFGDMTTGGRIDVNAVSDNGDRNKILATIVSAIDKYTLRYPERMIYFTGSTEARTRLYRMAVGLHLEELSLTYDIFAQMESQNQLVKFQKNMEISAFVIRRKAR
jgi:hypothetical protein